MNTALIINVQGPVKVLSRASGAALLESTLQADWIRRVRHSRAIVVTSKGQL